MGSWNLISRLFFVCFVATWIIIDSWLLRTSDFLHFVSMYCHDKYLGTRLIDQPNWWSMEVYDMLNVFFHLMAQTPRQKQLYIYYIYLYVLIYIQYIYICIHTNMYIYIHVYTHVKIHQHQPQRSTLSTSSVLGHLSFITSTHFQPNQVGDMQSYARWLMGVACQVVPLKIFFWKVRSTGSQMKACLFVSRISIYQVKR